MRAAPSGAPLVVVAREWGRIGCLGFGGPPAHVALLRELCVARRGWLSEEQFEADVAVTGLLPGPASTQLAILCGWRVRGSAGAMVGGLAFILPGLLAIIALAAMFLGDPPRWVRGLGAGAGAVVAAVAVQAAASLVGPSWARAVSRARWLAYVLTAAVAAALAGPFVVLVLLGCGLAELLSRRGATPSSLAALAWPPWPVAAASGGLGALSLTALKVGALSYGGGFVIIPLMRADAVDRFRWMTDAQFLDAVALGQATPGPVVHTVAVVGYAAAGVGGALLAALLAFAPSFAFVLVGGRHLERLRGSADAQAFLAGAGAAAIGAILGVAAPLAGALQETWQIVLLAGAALVLLTGRGALTVILLGAAAGLVAAAAGAPLPG